jgi:hypothetical protein
LVVLFSFIDARGVGQEPESFPLMRRPNLGRAEQTPLRIVPEVGKITEDKRETCPNKSGDVFQENVSGSHVTYDSCDGRP